MFANIGFSNNGKLLFEAKSDAIFCAFPVSLAKIEE